MRPTSHLVLLVAISISSLTLISGLSAQEKAKAEPAYQDLVGQYDAAYATWLKKVSAFDSKEYQELRKGGKYREASLLRDKQVPRPHLDFLPRFEKAATRHKGKPEEALFLVWMVTASASTRTPQPAQKRALDRLLAAHLDNPRLEPMMTAGKNASMYRWLGFDEFVKVMGVVAEKSPHKNVKANALYCRAIFQLDVRRFAKKDDPLSEEERAAAEADMRRVAELVPGTPLAMRAAGAKFQKERLAIGMVAPDIIGEDLDGVKFKLSDYRGKVVLLDFWGDW